MATLICHPGHLSGPISPLALAVSTSTGVAPLITPVRRASLFPARRLTTLIAAVPLTAVATYAQRENRAARLMIAVALP
ncbi:MAG: hypothetical protein R2729_29345 [Bryobacteraceae bacterium]